MNRCGLKYLVPSGAVVFVAYLWFVTAGHMTWWPIYTAYHAMQADAFLQGHAHLTVKPSPELLALPDPYDAAARKASGCEFIWDASLYHGKYYLYWGPAPALLLALAKKLFLPRDLLVGDPHLAFVFLLGICAAAAALLCAVRKRAYPDAPAWTLALGLFLVAFGTPAPYILARSSAYEVAIAAGQFFLLLGMYFVYEATPVRLFLAGSCWAAAVASRASLALPVIGLAAMVAWNVSSVYPASSRGNRFGLLLAFGIPLALGACSLVLYNVMRFGDPLEFGARYQLSVWNMPKLMANGTLDRSLGSTSVMLPNLRDYLVACPAVSGTFPYIRLQLPPWSGRLLIEPLSGILLTFPFCWFAMKPFYMRGDGSVRRLTHLLGAAVLLTFIPLLRLNMPTMRYLEDILPCITILGMIGVWKVLALPTVRGRARLVFLSVTVACAAYSIFAGAMLGFTGQYDHFAKFNPALFNALVAKLSF